MRRAMFCAMCGVVVMVAHAAPFATSELANGVRVEVEVPTTSVGSITDVGIILKAPAGGAMDRVLLLAGYNEAAASYVPSQPASAGAQFGGSADWTVLTSVSPPSYALWPMLGFTRTETGGPVRNVLEQAVGSDAATMLPAQVVPFERPDEHDWVTLAYADAAPGATAIRFAVPLVFTKPDASLYLWVGVAAGSQTAGKYMPVSLVSRLGEPAAAGSGPQPVVTSPKKGDRVGLSVDVVGRGQPGALIVIWTEVRRQKDNGFVNSVPGIRHKTEPDGSFHFRVATPRIYIGEDTPLVYNLHVRADHPGGQSQPVVIPLYPE